MPEVTDYYKEEPLDYVRDATRKSLMAQVKQLIKRKSKSETQLLLRDIYNYLKDEKDYEN